MSAVRQPLSRRGFLAAGGGISLAAMFGLSACGGSDSDDPNSAGGGNNLKLLLPGSVPDGWNEVLTAVNTKMQTDLGFSITPQFINWSNYGDQALLKFTAGENFDTALQARWLNMAQLAGSGSLVDVGPLIDKYPNLKKTLDPKLIELNKWSGKLWGIPQVNSAGRIHHFAIRQDLAEKYGITEITDYQTLEKFWYDVKQRDSKVIPIALSKNQSNLTCVPGPVAMFNAHAWENPNRVYQSFSGGSMPFFLAVDAKTTGSSDPVPFWEVEGVVEALRTIRKYYQDGIINRDALNSDSATAKGLFTNGQTASAWATTDGLSSTTLLPGLLKAVPGAKLANVVPLKGGTSAKPTQTFQSDNFTVLHTKGQSNERAMQLEDWLSIKENHDLISYGVEGRDWKPVGDDKFEQVSTYAFPGYALCWRTSLERRSSLMTESETEWFDWAQDYNNFTVDTFASFIPDVTPVKREEAQISQAFTQFANPLFFGAVDVDSGLDKLKKAVATAGLDKLQAEMAKQADAYLKTN
jgi:putative aldouronate transport system substrate-binding protein